MTSEVVGKDTDGLWRLIAIDLSPYEGKSVRLRMDFDTAPAETWVEIGYGIFLPGSGAKDIVGDDDVAHYVYVMSGVRF